MTCIQRSSPKQCSPLQAVRAPLVKCADKGNFHLRRLVVYNLERMLQIAVNRPDRNNVTLGCWSTRLVHRYSRAISLLSPSLIQTVGIVSAIEPFPVTIGDDNNGNNFYQRCAQSNTLFLISRFINTLWIPKHPRIYLLKYRMTVQQLVTVCFICNTQCLIGHCGATASRDGSI